jgi:hypothetical protein
VFAIKPNFPPPFPLLIGDTDPIRYRRLNPDGQFSGNILDEAMRGSILQAE